MVSFFTWWMMLQGLMPSIGLRASRFLEWLAPQPTFFEQLKLPKPPTPTHHLQLVQTDQSMTDWKTLQEYRLVASGFRHSIFVTDFQSPFSREVGQLRVRQEIQQATSYFRSKLDVPDAFDPWSYNRRPWRADELVRLSVPTIDTLYVFGQLKGNGDFSQNQNDFTGKTGVGFRWAPLRDTEVQIRTGRSINVSDSLAAAPVSWDRSQLMVEVLARVPLSFGLEVEYTGSALAGSTARDRDAISQDLRLNLPVGKRNELYFGATFRWENQLTQSVWAESAQVYLGLTLKH
jgi:hypothetical protein